MGYNKNVEFIPWMHSFSEDYHNYCMKYICTIKKGSIIGMELTPFELNFYKHLIDLRKQGDRSYYISVDFHGLEGIVQVNDALLDAVYLSSKRGLNIVPLKPENFTLLDINISYKYSSKLKKISGRKEELIVNDAVSKSIIQLLKTKDNLHVLFGISHIGGIDAITKNMFLKNYDSKYKINTNIKMDIFPDKFRKIINTQIAKDYELLYHKDKINYYNYKYPDTIKDYSSILDDFYSEFIAQKQNQDSRELRKRLERVIKDSKAPLKQKKLGIKALRMHMPRSNRPK